MAQTPDGLVVNEDWVKHLTASPDELLDYIDQHPDEFYSWYEAFGQLFAARLTLSRRANERKFRGNNLGGYFTVLFNWWLLHCSNIDQLYVKYQLYAQETKRTLGDFDFLFFDKASHGMLTSAQN